MDRDRGRAVLHAAAATVVGIAVLLPVMGQMGVAIVQGTTVPFAADFAAYRWDPLNAFRNSFETTDGRLSYAPPSGAFYLLQPVMPYWFGPLGPLAVWGGAWVIRRGGSVATTLLVGWPLLVLVFLAGSPYQNPRFFLAVLPPVATLVAVGLWRLAAAVDERLPADRRRASILVGASAATAWLVVALALAARYTDGFIARQARDLAATRRIEAMVPAGARLISLGPTGVFVYDKVPDVVELFFLTPAAAETLLSDGKPSYLVIDAASFDAQWAGRDPGLTVDAMRANPGLVQVGTEGGWTVYRIGPPG